MSVERKRLEEDDAHWAGGVRGVADEDHAALVPRRELRPVVQAKLHERARPRSAYVSGPLMVSHSCESRPF